MFKAGDLVSWDRHITRPTEAYGLYLRLIGSTDVAVVEDLNTHTHITIDVHNLRPFRTYRQELLFP